ncbi:hypothetical protein LINGRAHAP2_LOCUS2295 [Linum grandiflorum]
MGDPDAQYEWRMIGSNQINKLFSIWRRLWTRYPLHPGALYLPGAVYLTGNCVKKDVASALWCFHRASEKVSKSRK